MQINTHCYSIHVIIVYISNENHKTHLVEYAEYGYIQAISEWKKCLWPAQVAIAAHGHCLLLLNAIVQKKNKSKQNVHCGVFIKCHDHHGFCTNYLQFIFLFMSSA